MRPSSPHALDGHLAPRRPERRRELCVHRGDELLEELALQDEAFGLGALGHEGQVGTAIDDLPDVSLGRRPPASRGALIVSSTLQDGTLTALPFELDGLGSGPANLRQIRPVKAHTVLESVELVADLVEQREGWIAPIRLASSDVAEAHVMSHRIGGGAIAKAGHHPVSDRAEQVLVGRPDSTGVFVHSAHQTERIHLAHPGRDLEG